MIQMNEAMRRMALSLALTIVVSACSKAEVPLESNAIAEAAKLADYPRKSISSLPIQANEQPGGSVCSIEDVKGTKGSETQPDNSLSVELPASVSGWAYPPATLPMRSDAWLRLLPHDNSVGVAEFPLTLNIARPDVASTHGEAAAYSGFADVTIADLPPGIYDAQIVFVTAGARATCENARRLILR